MEQIHSHPLLRGQRQHPQVPKTSSVPVWSAKEPIRPVESSRKAEAKQSEFSTREPFLSIVTRHIYIRKELFERLVATLECQSDPDYEHVVIEDSEGRGLAWAEKQFEANKDRVEGRYVFIIDDDDYFIDDDFIREAKKVEAEHSPDVIMVRMQRLPFYNEVLPSNAAWGKRPVLGHIGSPCYLVRREVWQEHIHIWTEQFPGDYHFPAHLWDIGCSFAWLNRVVVQVDRIGFNA